MRKVSIILLATAFLVACEDKKKTGEDLPVGPEGGGEQTPPTPTKGRWISTTYSDPVGARATLKAEDLLAGGPRDPLSMTYAKANAPMELFRVGGEASSPLVNKVPFLAFVTADKAMVTVRHIKSLNGQNLLSQVVVPITCPDTFAAANKVEEGEVLYCIPLINAAIPNFLVPSDNSGSYVHDFTISFKRGSESTGVLSAKIASRIVIPGSNLATQASPDLRSLSLSDRLTMVTNDLIFSPRRDFRAFDLTGTVAPGVQTAWVITFSKVKLVMEEEIFYEMPVIPGDRPGNPIVSRGAGFYKRRSVIDSVSQFRLRAISGMSGSSEAYNLSSTGTSIVEIPITDPSETLRLFISPDFASDAAAKSMYEYVRPFGPTFCPREQAAFKPEEWRQARLGEAFVACEAVIRARIVDAADQAKKKVTSPMETFYGAFSYMPRMSGSVLGGTNGILSLRLTLTGEVKVAVRNPHAPSTLTEVGTAKLDTTYFFPTAINEMDDVIKKKARSTAPGLDTIQTSMQRKGVFELPRRNSGLLPAFPFQGEDRDDVFY